MQAYSYWYVCLSMDADTLCFGRQFLVREILLADRFFVFPETSQFNIDYVLQ